MARTYTDAKGVEVEWRDKTRHLWVLGLVVPLLPLIGIGMELTANLIRRSTKTSNRLGARIIRRHPARNEMLDATGDERLELVVGVALHRGSRANRYRGR